MPGLNFDLPSFDEYDVAHKNFVFKSCSESSLGTAQVLLDHSSNSRHRPDSSSFEFGNLQAAVEHALHKGSFLEDLELKTCFIYLVSMKLK